MAKKKAEPKILPSEEIITRSTGNVFADLGYADAGERQTKLRLAMALNGIITRRKLTQVEAAACLSIGQPKISALTNYKLDGFSVERLMTFLTALDQDVEIIVRAKPRLRRSGMISVHTAMKRARIAKNASDPPYKVSAA